MINKTWSDDPPSDPEVDANHEINALHSDLMSDEIREAKRVSKHNKNVFDNEKTSISITKLQKKVLNRFFRRRKPLWRDIADSLIESGARSPENIQEIIHLCNEGQLDKDIMFIDLLRTEFNKQ